VLPSDHRLRKPRSIAPKIGSTLGLDMIHISITAISLGTVQLADLPNIRDLNY
jgi:hypothetical protein